MSGRSSELCICPRCHRDYWGEGEFREHLWGEHSLDPAERLSIIDRARRRIQGERLAHGRARMKDWTLDTFPATDLAGRRALKAARDWINGDPVWEPRL